MLEHPFLDDYHDPNDEPTRSVIQDNGLESLFSRAYTGNQLLKLLAEEVKHWHR